MSRQSLQFVFMFMPTTLAKRGTQNLSYRKNFEGDSYFVSDCITLKYRLKLEMMEHNSSNRNFSLTLGAEVRST